MIQSSQETNLPRSIQSSIEISYAVKPSMKENNEKKMKDEDEISKLIKAFPKDIAALDKRSVLAKDNSQGSFKRA